jgi:hypothetical protein
MGQAYTRLKDQEKARMMFERVVDQYPDSPEAEVARKALEAESEKMEAEKIEADKAPELPPAPPTE